MSIKDTAKELFPPDLKPIQRWRVLMFIAVMLLIAGLIRAEFTYAREEAVQDLKKVTNSIYLSTLATRIRELAKEECEATTERLRNLLRTEMDDLQKEYKVIDGAYYPVAIKCNGN